MGGIDYFLCYRISLPGFTGEAATVDDAFGDATHTAVKAKRLCMPVEQTPVSESGAVGDTQGDTAGGMGLMCFVLERTTPEVGLASITSIIGGNRLAITVADEVCMTTELVSP